MLSLRQTPLVAPTMSPAMAPATEPSVTSANALQSRILEFPALQESLETFVSVIADEIKAAGGHAVVKLCCALPSYEEWSAGTDLDMHDLYELHLKLIRFLRSAVQRLRAVKISATYHLSPCPGDSPFALVRAIRPEAYTSPFIGTASGTASPTSPSSPRASFSLPVARANHSPRASSISTQLDAAFVGKDGLGKEGLEGLERPGVPGREASSYGSLSLCGPGYHLEDLEELKREDIKREDRSKAFITSINGVPTLLTS